MKRYSFLLYSGQKFTSYSDTDSRIIHWEERYLQILGLAKRNRKGTWIIPFPLLNEIDNLDSLRGYRLYLLNRVGNSKYMASPVKEIKREKI